MVLGRVLLTPVGGVEPQGQCWEEILLFPGFLTVKVAVPQTTLRIKFTNLPWCASKSNVVITWLSLDLTCLKSLK